MNRSQLGPSFSQPDIAKTYPLGYWISGLQCFDSKDATAAQLAKVELSPLGAGLHWEELDADFGVAELATGIFGSKSWMSELARFAGSKTSARKASSSRENGKRGGRPRLQKSS